MKLGVIADSGVGAPTAQLSATERAPDRIFPARAGQFGWLAAALAFTLLFSLRAMALGLRPGDVVQEDARQHVFWMARFRDPELFKDDLIANYYQSLAPPAYSGLYWMLSHLVEPLIASRILPIFLGITVALFTFFLIMRLHPAPAGAFLGTVLVSWYFWQYDDMASATPRAFLPPLLAAQLWSIVAGRPALAGGLVVMASLFYPAAGALGVALLGVCLLRFNSWRPSLTRERFSWLVFVSAAVLVGVVVLPGQLAVVSFGPTVSGDLAREMPEFGRRGRNEFFTGDAYAYWFGSGRSGIGLELSDGPFGKVPFLFLLASLAAPLPLLLLFRRHLPSAAQVSGKITILLRLLLASFALFFVAHLLLFRMYYPARYVKWSLPLVLAVAGGLVLGILLQEIGARFTWRARSRALIASVLALALSLGLAAYPAPYNANFARDQNPAVTAYLRDMPKNTLVAGPSLETNLVPVFAARSVLVAREFAIPYHLGYYRELRQRTEDLIEAYYAASPVEVADFAGRYGIDVFLVDRSAFDRRRYVYTWVGHQGGFWEPFTSMIGRELERRSGFALLDLARRCAVLDDGEVAVVPSSCVRESG